MLPRRHLSIHLTGEAALALERLRRQWDPVMTRVAPPHITLVYPEEVVDEPLLLERIARAAPTVKPFDVLIGEVVSDDEGRGGVFASVTDQHGILGSLRADLLRPPQVSLDYPFHSTIAHPRTSADPVGCWAELQGMRLDIRARVSEILHTSTGDDGRTVLAVFPFGSDEGSAADRSIAE